MPAFDFEGVFDEDYLYFYGPELGREASDRQAAFVAGRLELRPGEQVLDVPCGHGRIAVPLAAAGCRVTGLDANPRYLELARQEASVRGVELELVHGDMRALPWTGAFDAVVNWFSSFGYFEDGENRAVLAGFHRALRPGGRLLLETLHRDRVVRSLPPEGPALVLKERGDDLMLDRSTFDAVESRVESERVVVRDGRVRRMGFSVRLFAPSELRAWLEEAGFAEVVFLDERGSPFRLEARRLVALARRPA